MWVESNLSRNVLNANLECLATLYWGSFFSLGKRIYFGGIAALNHRLQAVMPSASRSWLFVSGGIAVPS
ncbi:MAG: hypothetical protein RL553_2350 [Planctomycetota bacterium]|jgi:hypothetical protein